MSEKQHQPADTVNATPDIDNTRPQDFDDDVATDNEIPSREVLKSLEDYIVLDKYRKSHSFKSLYNGPHVAKRVLIIFVRHFYCGNCQDYLRTVSKTINYDTLTTMSTAIVVIGCGDPDLIPEYAEASECTLPMYTDPKRGLFKALGMTTTLSPGKKPGYMPQPFAFSVAKSFIQAVKALPSGKTFRSGNHKQVGGEFLFEPVDLDGEAAAIQMPDPPSAAADEVAAGLSSGDNTGDDAKKEGDKVAETGERKRSREEDEAEAKIGEKQITWCHRMKNTRDHVEMPELMEVLGLSGEGKMGCEKDLPEKALQERKGVRMSMVKPMSEVAK